MTKYYYVIKQVTQNYYWSEMSNDFCDFQLASKYANKHTALIASEAIKQPFTLVLVNENIES